MRAKNRKKQLLFIVNTFSIILTLYLFITMIQCQTCGRQRCCNINPCTANYCLQRNSQTWVSTQSFTNYQYTKLVLYNNSCQPCSYNCRSCNSMTTCTSCAKGFYLSAQTSKCELCSYKCQSCTVVNSITKCSACDQGTYLDSITLTCKSCPSGSKSCSSSTAIIQCFVGYKKSSNSLYCTSCPANCNSCPLSDTVCASCEAGYYLTNNNYNCSLCTISNCKSCLRVGSTISCTSCNTGYRLSSGTCVLCSANCNICTSVTNCTQCATSYYLLGGACVNVLSTNLIKNCQTYSSSNICSVCVPGYYFKNSICQPCSLLCLTCSGDNFGNCLTCKSNSNLFNMMCLINNFPLTSTYNLFFSFPYSSVFITNLNTLSQLTCNGKFITTIGTGTKIKLQLNNLKGYRIQVSFRIYSLNGSTSYYVTLQNSEGNFTTNQTTSISGQKYNLCNSDITTSYYMSQIKSKTFNVIKKKNTLLFYTDNSMNLSLHQIIVTVYKCNQLCIECSQTLCTECLLTKLYTQDAYCVYTCSNSYYIYKNISSTTNPNQCVSTCPLGSYTLTSNVSCVPCTSPCLTCLNDIFCLSCVQNYYLTKDNTCNKTCPYKYYGKIQTKTCEKCVGRCSTCLNEQKCLSCKVGFLYNVTYMCVDSCEQTVIGFSGLYADLATLFCELCNSTCLNCEYNKNRCTSCISAKYFYQEQNQCLSSCPTGYYYKLNDNICLSCSYPCKTCSFSSSNCTSCLQGYLFQPNRTCITDCPGYYFQDNVNLICQKCDLKCTQCYGSDLNCLSCQEGFYFYDNTCESTCPDQYYKNSLLRLCSKCVGLCKNCNNQTYCLSCKSNFLYNGSCIGSGQCPIGYYADIKTLKCQICSISCQECQYTATTCTKCNTSQINKFLQSNKCVQKCSSTKYYPLSNSTIATCQPCQQPCLTCLSSSLCLSCINGYKYSNNICSSTCSIGTYFNSTLNDCMNCSKNCQVCSSNIFCQKCESLFYLNSLSITSNQCLGKCNVKYYAETFSSSCQKCIYPCDECLNSIDCLSCLSGVVYEYRCISSCPDSTFLNVTTYQCVICLGNCLTCSYNPTSCTSCKTGYYLFYSNSSCLVTCPSTFYPQQLTKACASCPSSCSSCFNSTYCTACIPNKSFHSPQTNVCVQYCPGGYFGNLTTLNCDKCSLTCQTCRETKSNCISCASGYLLVKVNFTNNLCQDKCPLGSYSEGNYCYECSFPCKTCLTSIKCITCVQGTYYHAQSQSCLLNCPSQSYYNFTTQQCKVCQYPCKSCQNSTYCLSCSLNKTNNNSTLYLYSGKCVNTCPQKYYPDQSGICNKCYGLCQTCTAKYYCLKCLAGYAYDGYCYSSCPGGTYANTTSNKCQTCNSKCSECILSSTYCTKCSGGLYVYKGNCSSTCPNGTYQDNGQCITCTFPCINCNSKNTCFQCLGGYLLYMDISCINDVTPCPNDFYKMDSKACVPVTWCPSNYFINQKQKTCSQKCDRKKYTHLKQKKCLDSCLTNEWVDKQMICKQWTQKSPISLMIMKAITYIESSYVYIEVSFNQSLEWIDVSQDMYEMDFVMIQEVTQRRLQVNSQQQQFNINNQIQQISQIINQNQDTTRVLFTKYTIPAYNLQISKPRSLKLKIANNYPLRINLQLQAYRLKSSITQYPLQNPQITVSLPSFTAYTTSQIYAGIIIGQFSQGICWFIMLLSIFFLFKNRLSDLYILWDTVQLLYLMIFLDIQYPPNLNQFLNGLKYTHFTFLPSIFAAMYSKEQNRNVSDRPFYAYSFDNGFIRNSGKIYFAMILVFGVLLLLKIAQLLIHKVQYIKQKCKQYPFIKSFVYKGILRYRWHHTSDFMFLSYPIIMLFSFAQIKFISQNSDNIFSNILAILTSLIYFIWVIFVGYKLYKHYKNISKGKLVNNLKCFYRGIQKQNKFGIALVLVRYARKLFYCLIISMFSMNPMYALPILTFLSILMGVFIFINLPFKKKLSNIINIIAEGILVIAYILIALINFNNDLFDNSIKQILGWICCILLAIMIFILIYEIFCKTMFYLEPQNTNNYNLLTNDEKNILNNKNYTNLTQQDKQLLRKKAEQFFDSLLPKLKQKFNFDQDSDDQLYQYQYEQGDSQNSQNNQQRQKEWNDSENQDQFKHYNNGSQQNDSQGMTDGKSKKILKGNQKAPQYLVRCVKDIQ